MNQVRLEPKNESIAVVEVKSTPSQSEVKSIDNYRTIDYHPLLWLPMSICLTVLGGALVLLFKPKKRIDKNCQTSSVIDRIPCRQCQFFTRNPHLYCTVRPTEAMTENAIDCPDFQKKQEEERE
ncbi:MAG: hypothetical protein ACRC2R_05305 [Xenococcaceae cyanobacterium]